MKQFDLKEEIRAYKQTIEELRQEMCQPQEHFFDDDRADEITLPLKQDTAKPKKKTLSKKPSKGKLDENISMISTSHNVAINPMITHRSS